MEHAQQNQIVPMDPIRYSAYLRLLERVLGDLLGYFDGAEREAKIVERESVKLYAEKFIETVRSLRLRYIHSPMYRVRPGIDLTESGFPHYYDINQLTADLSQRSERLPKLAPLSDLKLLLLEHVIATGLKGDKEERRDAENNLLWQISERLYLERLDLRKQFFQFTPGKLFSVPPEEFTDTEPNRRAYSFSWGCYDSETNRPYVYLMLFTQDMNEKPFDENSPDYVKFLDTVQHIAARAPANLAAIGTRLDESFRTLFPKAIKRFCIGPLVSPSLFREQAPAETSLAGKILPIFERAELEPQDYVLFFNVEYTFSKREEVLPRLVPFGSNKPRQVFDVSTIDPKRKRRGATDVASYALLPHRLRQHLTKETMLAIPELGSDVNFLIYQPDGGPINVG